ncbi:response regulator [Tieghemiomyces parasiticus]|uniref:Response regulator n=1 Tax=Tieghemiomyces parasiticus TaxID=78921 RepID=A0A9W7ZRT0_9FUNG|nr:response regulator [Tieghemiomyces parasiticus]
MTRTKASAAGGVARSVAHGVLVANCATVASDLARNPCLTTVVQAVWWFYGYHQFATGTEAPLSLPVLGRLATSPLGPFIRFADTWWRFPGDDTAVLGAAAFTCLLVAVIGLLSDLASLVGYATLQVFNPVLDKIFGYFPGPLAAIYHAPLTATGYLLRIAFPGFQAVAGTSGSHRLVWSLSWSHIVPSLSFLLLWALHTFARTLAHDLETTRADRSETVATPSPPVPEGETARATLRFLSTPSSPSLVPNVSDNLALRTSFLHAAQTMAHLQRQMGPGGLFAPRSQPEFFAACAIPVPTAAFMAVHTFLRHVRFLATLVDDAAVEPDSVPINRTAPPSTFDLVDLMQRVTDVHAGLAASLDLEVFHGHALRVQAHADDPFEAAAPSGPLDAPQQDLAAEVYAAYDLWYHVLHAHLWALEVTAPRGACLEVAFALREGLPSCEIHLLLHLRRGSTGAFVDPVDGQATELLDELDSHLAGTDRFMRHTGLPVGRRRWISTHGPELPSLSRPADASPILTARADPAGAAHRALLLSLTLPYETVREPTAAPPTRPLRARVSDLFVNDNLAAFRSHHAPTTPRSTYPFGAGDGSEPRTPRATPAQERPRGTPGPATDLWGRSVHDSGIQEALDYFPFPSSTAQSGRSPTSLPTSPLTRQARLGSPDATHSSQLPSVGDDLEPVRLAAFLRDLRGLTMSLYFRPDSVFARKAVDFLAVRAGMQLNAYLVTGDAADATVPVRLHNLTPSSQAETKSSASSRARQPHAFIMIDDDLATLRCQFHRLRNTLSFDYGSSARSRRPNGSGTEHGTLASSVPRASQSETSRSRSSPLQPQNRVNVSASTIRATSLIYFTSVGNYKRAKLLLHELLDTPHPLPAPEVLVLPKPAGTKRLVASLYAALHHPTLDSPLVAAAASPYLLAHSRSTSLPRIIHTPVRVPGSSPTLATLHQFSPGRPVGTPVVTVGAKPTPITVGTSSAHGLADLPVLTTPVGPVSQPLSELLTGTLAQTRAAPRETDDTVGPPLSPKSRAAQPPSPLGRPDRALPVSTGQALDALTPTLPVPVPTAKRPESSKAGSPPPPVTSPAEIHTPGARSPPSAVETADTKPLSKGASRMKNRLDQLRRKAARKRQEAEPAPLGDSLSPALEITTIGNENSPAIGVVSPAASAPDQFAPERIEGGSEGFSATPPILIDAGSASASNLRPFGLRQRRDPLTRRDSTNVHCSPPPNVPIPPIKVLIVEDSLVDRRIIDRFMNNQGIKHDMASTGKEALAKWQADVFHLVFMDLQLPDMSGIEITREIRRLEETRLQESLRNQSAASSEDDGGLTVDEQGRWSSLQLGGRQNSITVPSGTGHPRHHGGQGTGLPAAEGATTPLSPLLHTPTMISTGPVSSPAIIVALTASNLESDRMAAYAAGCNDFLIKPIDTHWMRQKLVEWGAMHALIDFEGFKNWKVEDAKRQRYKIAQGSRGTAASAAVL